MDTGHSQSRHTSCGYDMMTIKTHVYIGNATQQPFIQALKTPRHMRFGYSNKNLSDSDFDSSL